MTGAPFERMVKISTDVVKDRWYMLNERYWYKREWVGVAPDDTDEGELTLSPLPTPGNDICAPAG